MNEVPFFIAVLKSEFEKRAMKNSGYSLRAYARDLDMSAPLLSGILKGEKGLSVEKARRTCLCLGISLSDGKKFILSVTAHCSRSPSKRVEAEEILKKLSTRMKNKNILSDSSLSYVAGWIPFAILELCELPECEHTTRWFAKMLSLNEIVIERSIQRLIEHGQIEKISGRYKAVLSESTTEMEMPNAIRRRMHLESLDRAKQSLQRDDLEKREFISMTLAFHQSDIQEAKEAIREFQEEFADRFYRHSKKKRNSVYQLNTQLFPLAETKSRKL